MRTERLSRAIREGCKLVGNQGFDDYFDLYLEDEEVCSVEAACALGAAWYYITKGNTDPTDLQVRERFPILDQPVNWFTDVVPKSEPGYSVKVSACYVSGLVGALNDTLHWTREQIADLIEWLEDGLEATPCQL